MKTLTKQATMKGNSGNSGTVRAKGEQSAHFAALLFVNLLSVQFRMGLGVTGGSSSPSCRFAGVVPVFLRFSGYIVSRGVPYDG